VWCSPPRAVGLTAGRINTPYPFFGSCLALPDFPGASAPRRGFYTPSDRSARLRFSPESLLVRNVRSPFTPQVSVDSSQSPFPPGSTFQVRLVPSSSPRQPACSARVWHPNCLVAFPSLLPVTFGHRISTLRAASLNCPVEADPSKRAFAHPRRPRPFGLCRSGVNAPALFLRRPA
jgi:hypothetical protein